MSSSGWFAYAPGSGAVFGSSSVSPGGPVAPGGTGGPRPELADLSRLARRGVRRLVATARADEQPSLQSALHDHLGPVGGDVDVVEERWAAYEHVNVQRGLDAWLAADGRDAELVGVVGFRHRPFGLGELVAPDPGHETFGLRPGTVSRVNLSSGPDGETQACVRCGLYLVTEGDARLALLVRAPEPDSGIDHSSVQVLATDAGRAREVAKELREHVVRRNVFRGQVLSFGGEVFGPQQALVTFHPRPRLDADAVILPADVVEAVRRQVVGVAAHKDRLLAAGQHLKRGLLLYGPPGVGKTHTVRYLTSTLTGTTVIQLTGAALHLIGEACSVARALQPSMLVVEDVDLIAQDRGEYPGQHPLLFQLLNEMDGLTEDADVVFVLTTNRPDVLEPALAARPGRIDQAVALELPDAEARRALVELYRGRLELDRSRLDTVIERTEGVTASFLKELLRRAALVAAEGEASTAEGEASAAQAKASTPGGQGPGGVSRRGDGPPLVVSADALDAALDELLATRNAMTQVLLGAARAPGASPGPAWTDASAPSAWTDASAEPPRTDASSGSEDSSWPPSPDDLPE